MAARSKNKPHTRPEWDDLYRICESQSGYFSRADAADCGFSAPLLHHHVNAGAIHRARRGVYRLARFPTSDTEDLVVVWLWSGKAGTFSHETALVLHGLSDALPNRAHLTVPESWRIRRLTTPSGVVVHHARIGTTDRVWFQSIPITSVVRTIRDLVADQGDPDLIRQSIAQAVQRGLVSRELARELRAALNRRDRSRVSG
ncbi:MAG: type IV toxin-antitoxin system AbiEi family antitoxin domain-containing protein [Planctomycetes bacterium]|nr:type IV toxin-antitoxin system AbiEi family antitoxin domain-containing protein [Planctomycetota bacterium]MCC7170012.1 type IV toxin-antitoxin system AbiEi family antitoxin domain-containing protein [Planctomycetota bacterium]